MRAINLSELAGIWIIENDDFYPRNLYKRLKLDKDAKEYPDISLLNVDIITLGEFIEWEYPFSIFMKNRGIQILIG